MGDVIEFRGVAKLREELAKREALITKLMGEYKALQARHDQVIDRHELVRLQLVEVLTGLTAATKHLTQVAMTLQEMERTLNGK